MDRIAESAAVRISPEEYLRREKASDAKHEYFDGQVFAMTGASRAHVRIRVNLTRILAAALRHRSCEPFDSDMRLRVDATGLYTYPDLTIVCDPIFDGETLLNPIIIIEILSSSTERYDTTTKFGHYERLPSVREVWFVSQDRMWIERNRRTGPGQWLREWFTEGEMKIDDPEMTIPVAEVYERVELDPNPPLR